LIYNEKMTSELLLKTSNILNSASIAFRGKIQVVQVKVTPHESKEVKRGVHNMSNLFCNRSVKEYANIKILKKNGEVFYFFLIENAEEPLLDLKKTLELGIRKTFSTAEIVEISGKEALAIQSLDDLLTAQNTILKELEDRLKIAGQRSYWFSGTKLPPVCVRKIRAA